MASIQKRENGKWRARYRDAAGKEHARHFPRKVDAQRWLNEVTASVVTGMYVDPNAGKVTFDAYWSDWSSRQVWVDGTLQASSLAQRSVPFGSTPMADVRPSHVEAWVKDMVAKEYAPTTISTRFQSIRSVFRAAVRDRVVATDPTVGVVLPRRRRREVSMEIPAAEDVAAIVTAAESRMRCFVALCAYAGLRLGEASAVKDTDIDFPRRTLKLRRQVQRKRGGSPEVRAPKYGSERDIALPDELCLMLARHIEVEGVSSEGWLFTGGAGDPISPTTVNAWWLRTVKVAGLAPVKLHSLRHFYASGLISAGCDVVTVQRALGHASASVTLDTYSHLWPDAEDRTRAAAAGLMMRAGAAQVCVP